MTYREPGLSRDIRAIWSEPARPVLPRCEACGYRQDANGHRYACGEAA